jgi:hypothetical protein
VTTPNGDNDHAPNTVLVPNTAFNLAAVVIEVANDTTSGS